MVVMKSPPPNHHGQILYLLLSKKVGEVLRHGLKYGCGFTTWIEVWMRLLHELTIISKSINFWGGRCWELGIFKIIIFFFNTEWNILITTSPIPYILNYHLFQFCHLNKLERYYLQRILWSQTHPKWIMSIT